MDIKFSATESVELEVIDQGIPIQHYLRQPYRLVQAIAEPSLMEQLSEVRYAIAMRPLNFMDLYYFQPTVILKVWTDAKGCVYLKSESCEIRGIEYINNRFSLRVQGKLYPELMGEKTLLKGKAELEVKVELPPPLWLTPRPLLEVAGNGLLKSVLLRIKQKLSTQLIKDNSEWAKNSQGSLVVSETRQGLKESRC